MLDRYHLCFVLLVCLTTGAVARAQSSASGSQTAGPTPRVFLLDGTAIAEARAAVMSGDKRFLPAVQQLRSEADAAMNQGPFSVVSKPQTPPSGDKHDYMSQGPYWWPNPGTDDGLPYVQRDGERNPEAGKLDRGRLGGMTRAATTFIGIRAKRATRSGPLKCCACGSSTKTPG